MNNKRKHLVDNLPLKNVGFADRKISVRMESRISDNRSA